jgi:beta-lactamase regulating signal transducer with metallopeptidase domain
MNIQLSFVTALSAALLHSIWQLALIALLAALSLAALRRASAATRHAVGMFWLVAMAAAPVATLALCGQAPALPGASPAWGEPALARAPALLPGLPEGSPGTAWLLVCLAQAWLLGVVAMAVRTFGGWRWMLRFERQEFADLPPHWQRRVDALHAAMGISRRVAVRLGARVKAPFTSHLLRPLIWLPLGLLTRLPADQVEALLAHELAHIRRLDWCWNALQCAVESLLFHHPAMWWLSRRVREEREHACDDLAVAVCGDAIALAEALAGLQRRARPLHAPRFGLAADGGSLMKRISHLLSGTSARPGWRVPGVLLLLVCGGGLLAMQVAPPAHLLTNLTTDASSTGPLTPGNYREYSARYLGEKERRYRVSMDAAGRVSETYTEGGQPRPFDADAKRWLAAMADMSSTPPRAQPVPARAAPGQDSDEFVALTDTIRDDPRVVAVTGRPVHYDRASLHGSIHTWGARDFHLWGIDDPVGGTAEFTLLFEGPDGRVNVRYSGRTSFGGAWKTRLMELTPVAS